MYGFTIYKNKNSLKSWYLVSNGSPVLMFIRQVGDQTSEKAKIYANLKNIFLTRFLRVINSLDVSLKILYLLFLKNNPFWAQTKSFKQISHKFTKMANTKFNFLLSNEFDKIKKIHEDGLIIIFLFFFYRRWQFDYRWIW